MYRQLIRPLLFALDSESAHNLVMGSAGIFRVPPLAKLFATFCSVDDPKLQVDAFGCKFNNPVGLAAGFDKECRAFELFASLGFGFIEFGTITASSQPGNPRPRIFRLPDDQALINRMGFPSAGAAVLERRLSRVRRSTSEVRVGINIGKTKAVPIERAHEDYLESFRRLSELGDYFVLNISSPNTPELRMLQERSRLEGLLKALQAENKSAKPMLIKIAPDLSFGEIDDILDCCMQFGIAGIIATNTTFSREGLKTQSAEQGGLSGKPLFSRARSLVAYISRATKGALPIIGVGGIFSGADAVSMIKAGASLVQIYTALIYEGPLIVRRINTGISDSLRTEGVASVSELVGVENYLI